MGDWAIAAIFFLALLAEWYIIEWAERRRRG
jgi:hypothetical protein